MDTIVKIIGIIMTSVATVYLLKPQVMKRLIEFFRQGKRIYFAASLRLVVAVVFLLAARECDITWVIVLLGILLLISALLIFILGAEKLKSILDWYLKKSLLVLRILALIALALGAITIYAA
jgi:hypothetical protein